MIRKIERVPFILRSGFFIFISLIAADAFAQYGQGAGDRVNNYDPQQGSYASYGPMPNMDMIPTQANPFIGSWFGATPVPNSSGHIVSFTEFLPNGNIRATSIMQGGTMNGIRMQFWGRYTVKQIGPKRYKITSYLKGYAPREICTSVGACQPNNLPSSATETDDVQSSDNFHSHSEVNGVVTDVDVSRAPVPQQLTAEVGPRLNFTPPWQPAGGGASTILPYSPGGILSGGSVPSGSTYHVPGQGGTCDDAQQNRICTINNGHMYTNSQGCRICAGPN